MESVWWGGGHVWGLPKQSLVPNMAGGAGCGNPRLVVHPRVTLLWDWLQAGTGLRPPLPGLFPSRCLESQQEGMAAPRGSQRGPEEQEGKAVPSIPQIPLSLVSGTESDPLPQSSWVPSGTGRSCPGGGFQSQVLS